MAAQDVGGWKVGGVDNGGTRPAVWVLAAWTGGVSWSMCSFGVGNAGKGRVGVGEDGVRVEWALAVVVTWTREALLVRAWATWAVWAYVTRTGDSWLIIFQAFRHFSILS